MFAKTERDVLVEYPIETVYDALIDIFPVKYYSLHKSSYPTYSITVADSSNFTFIMFVKLTKNTPNSTIVNFVADYPHAIADITGGGKKAINTILEELLNKLDSEHKSKYLAFDKTTDFEVVNADNFVNPVNSETNTKSIILGYALCLLSFILPLWGFLYCAPTSNEMAMAMVIGVLSFSFAICTAAILQYSENSKTKIHGRIQTIICGLWFILAGLMIHYILSVVGIIIVAIVLGYFLIRDWKYN